MNSKELFSRLSRVHFPVSTFWVLQVVGWSGWCLLSILFVVMCPCAGYENRAIIYTTHIMNAGLGIGVTWILHSVYRLIINKNSSLIRLMLAVFFFTILFSLIWIAVYIGCELWFLKLTGFPFDSLYYRLIDRNPVTISLLLMIVRESQIQFYTLLVWGTLYFFIRYWYDYHRQRESALQSESLVRQSRLQFLTYQLNPHFLFNAFNSIHTVIDDDKTTAQAMIIKLAEFLRYSLQMGDQEQVMICDELEAVRNYLDIEKLRYGDSLKVEIIVSERAGRLPIPCFLIHSLVENAVKHGMKTSPMPLRIRIEAVVDKDELMIRAVNSGRWMEKEEPSIPGGSTRVGLNNIRQRLALKYQDQARFSLNSGPDQVQAEIRILLTALNPVS